MSNRAAIEMISPADARKLGVAILDEDGYFALLREYGVEV